MKKYNYNFTKWFLHTKLGAFIGYKIGISGYNRIDITSVSPEGVRRVLRPSYNARVNVGAALSASLLSGTTLGGISSPLPAKYIALSTSSLTPAMGNTTLTGETVATGLTRAAATMGTYVAPVSLDGAASYVASATFTNSSGSTVVILSSAIFDASSSGNMFVEANLNQTLTLANFATAIVNWTVNI